MKARLLLGLVVCALLAVPGVSSAQQPGEIFGKVTDTSGAVMPGVSVTLTSPVLLQPQAALTSATGTYRFPQLPIGLYTVKFELPGFSTVVREGIRIEIGFNAQINATMTVSAVQETVTVSGESPVVDTRDTGRGSRFNQEALQAIPSARDPWVIIEQAAGVAMDRQNVGGSASGQQSNFVARGANFSQQKWNLDGVDITDMNATGGSPVYYDFDAFEEMQISTGGADVTMMTPGVGVNLVTKSGTDMFRGSSRYYYTDDKFEANNATDDIRRLGATSGNPIQNIKDFGIEAGGPIKRGRAWIWGSYGKQDIRVGVNGFYKPTAECQTMKADLKKDAMSHSISDIRGCLNADQTLLNNYNAKAAVELFRNNQFAFYINAAEKVRNARDASDTRPIETTWKQAGVSPDSGYGSRWWRTGMPKTYKWSDRQIFSDKLMMEFQYAHVGNNFVLDFHEPQLADVQVAYDMNTGVYGNSFYAQYIVRPTDSVDVTGSYFLPGTMGGDHSLKFGFKLRNDEALTATHYGGNAYAVFANGVPAEAWLFRDGLNDYILHNRSAYVQDTFTRKRLVVNAGLRFDYQSDAAKAAPVDAHPFYGQPTLGGEVFDQLPAVTFDGQDAVGKLKNLSPRIGVTYDLTGDSRNVFKFNYSRYVGQIGSGGLAQYYNPVKVIEIDYPWSDLNTDGVVQPGEVDMSGGYLWVSSGYDPRNPTALTTTTKVSPELGAAKTDEFIVGMDHQIGRDFAVNGSFIWRRYSNFLSLFRDGLTSDSYVARTYTPPATACRSPLEPRCETITYYQPSSQLPVAQTMINTPDYNREYRGVEFSGRKRMSNSWMMNTSFSYNVAPVHYESPRSYQDPTNIERLNGGEYAEQSSNSGLDNVFVNAKWIFRLSGAYTLPIWRIGVAGFYNARSGYLWLPVVQTPTRPFGAGSTTVYLDKVGDLRLPTFQQLDLRVDKLVTIGKLKLTASMDVFNVFNDNTILSQRRTQNASNANYISSIVPPRVLRFGVRASW